MDEKPYTYQAYPKAMFRLEDASMVIVEDAVAESQLGSGWTADPAKARSAAEARKGEQSQKTGDKQGQGGPTPQQFAALKKRHEMMLEEIDTLKRSNAELVDQLEAAIARAEKAEAAIAAQADAKVKK